MVLLTLSDKVPKLTGDAEAVAWTILTMSEPVRDTNFTDTLQ